MFSLMSTYVLLKAAPGNKHKTQLLYTIIFTFRKAVFHQYTAYTTCFKVIRINQYDLISP